MTRIRPVLRTTTQCPCCLQETETVILSKAYGFLTPHERQFVGLLERGIATHEAIEAELWGDDPDGGPLTMNESKAVLARKIRAKLKQAGLPYTVKNLYGVGYRLERVE